MPCRYDPTPEELAEARAQDVLNSKAYKSLKKELDLTTRLLCSVLGEIEFRVKNLSKGMTANSINFAIVTTLQDLVFYHTLYGLDVQKWWSKHQKLDLARQAREKLTPEEREALGIKD